MLEKGGERSIPSLYFPYALIRLLDHNVDSGDILLFLNTGMASQMSIKHP